MSTGNEIVIVSPKDIIEAKSLAKDLALSALMPQALRKKPEDVMAIVLAGAELGLAPMTAIRGIHLIQGKMSLSADLMGALCQRSSACEYLTLIESTSTIATYETKRRGAPAPVRMSFTIDQARVAGVLANPTWQKYPEAMLRARCLAVICRAVYPDLCLGLYDEDSGEIVEGTSTPIHDSKPTEQAAHVAAVADKLRTMVAVHDPNPLPVVEGEIVAEPAAAAVAAGARELDMMRAKALAAIEAAQDQAAIQALIPKIRAYLTKDPGARDVLKPAFEARAAAIRNPPTA